MSDEQQPQAEAPDSPDSTSADEAAPAAAEAIPAPEEAASEASEINADMPDEWKPEPRSWSWNDVFTAPMLAFKPKCMLISAATATIIGLFSMLWFGQWHSAMAEHNIWGLESLFKWGGIAIVAALRNLSNLSP